MHVDDATGWAVQQALERAALANPNITLLPDMVAIDLIADRHRVSPAGDRRIWGAYALNRSTGHVEALTARAEAWRPWRAYAVIHVWKGSMAAPKAMPSVGAT